MVSNEDGYVNAGLLVLRIGIGCMFLYHGLPKLLGGPAVWTELGKAMGALGVTFAPVFWGFMAAFSEAFGAVALITGLLIRPFCALLAIEMAVAANMHLRKGDGLLVASHAIEAGIVFLSLIFTGAGKYRIGKF